MAPEPELRYARSSGLPIGPASIEPIVARFAGHQLNRNRLMRAITAAHFSTRPLARDNSGKTDRNASAQYKRDARAFPKLATLRVKRSFMSPNAASLYFDVA